MPEIEKKNKTTAENISNKEYEFNLGIYRIETISEILNVCAKKYRKAIMERNQETIHDYQAMVNVLYTETYIYMEEETEFQFKNVDLSKDDLLTQYLDDFKQINGEEQIEHLKKIRSIYLSLRKLLQDVGIDIPQEEKMETTDVFTSS